MAKALWETFFIILFVTLTGITNAWSQPVSLQKIREVDSLFTGITNWASAPGCVVAVVRNDSLIYAKGYGMANLEYGTVNQPSTLYDIGSVSKQFTAFCIMLLVQQHKINLDDDIHKYIPWLLIKNKITIRNLLHHTSGIREYFQLLAIAGKSSDDAFTQELAIHILKGEQTLNNNPGDAFLYSNSNYLLLAEIIKKVSGQTLRKFADSAIFKPLQMKTAYVSDDYTEVQTNRAYSYQSTDSLSYKKAFATDADVGAGNVFCNVEDMAKWVINFYKPTAGNNETITLLTQKQKLNNGTETSYAAGINVGDYKGWTLYEHDGESGGFNTCVSVFPDVKMGIIVFANSNTISSIDKNFALADLFLPAGNVNDRIASPASHMIYTYSDTSFIKIFTGKTYSDKGTQSEFVWNHKQFYWLTNHDSNLLIQAPKDTFYSASQPDKKFVFTTTSSGARVADEYSLHHLQRLYITSEGNEMPDTKLSLYTGTYYCLELDCSYHIRQGKHGLVVGNNLYDDTSVWFDGQADMFSNFWWMSHLHFSCNRQKAITGFEVDCNRVFKLKFIKIK